MHLLEIKQTCRLSCSAKLKKPCRRNSTSSSSTGEAAVDTRPGLEVEVVVGGRQKKNERTEERVNDDTLKCNL